MRNLFLSLAVLVSGFATAQVQVESYISNPTAQDRADFVASELIGYNLAKILADYGYSQQKIVSAIEATAQKPAYLEIARMVANELRKSYTDNQIITLDAMTNASIKQRYPVAFELGRRGATTVIKTVR